MAADPLLAPGVTAGIINDELCASWSATVFQMAREVGAQVLGPPVPPTVGRNHYQVRIRLGDGRHVRLLLNAAAGMVAAADDGDPGRLDAPFDEVPRGDLFGLISLRVLTPGELEAPLTDDEATDLMPSERRDVAYHRPPRIGDVIFNWFD